MTFLPAPGYGVPMAAPSAVRVYEALKSHLGEEDARLFIEYIEDTTREARGELATKADLAELRAATKADLAALRADLEKQLASLKTEIAEVKADLIKWMFLFWIGQVAVLFGLMKFVLAPA